MQHASLASFREGQGGRQAAGMVGMRFNTIGVSDGISMGTEGMSYSLQSRDLIADSIETMMGGPVVRRELIAFPAATRTCRAASSPWGGSIGPSLMIYGGTIRAGALPRAEARYHLRVPELRRVSRRATSTMPSGRDRAPCVSRGRRVRRHVHGEHHGVGHRGAGDVAALQFFDSRGRSVEADGVRARGRGDAERCWSSI